MCVCVCIYIILKTCSCRIKLLCNQSSKYSRNLQIYKRITIYKRMQLMERDGKLFKRLAMRFYRNYEKNQMLNIK